MDLLAAPWRRHGLTKGKNWTDSAGTSEGCEVFVSLVRAFLGNLLLIKQTFRIEAEYLNIHLWDDQFPVWCAGLPSPVRECRRCAGQTGDCQCAARWQDSRVLLALAARANNDDEQRTCQWLWLSRQGKWLWGLRGLGRRKYWCW